MAANASQSVYPPAPPVSVAVTVPPGAVVVSLTVSVGGGVAANATLGDVPPPGAGDTTVTVFEPADAMSAAAIAACSCVALTNVVGRDDPVPSDHRRRDEARAVHGQRERRAARVPRMRATER